MAEPREEKGPEEEQSPREQIREAARGSLSDTENIEDVRARLYKRGGQTESFGRSTLSKREASAEQRP